MKHLNCAACCFRRRCHSPLRRRMACAGRIWICVKPLVQLASRSCRTSSGLNEVFSTTVSSTVKIWSPTDRAPHRSEILAGMMLEMKIPDGCIPSIRLKSEDRGMKLLNTKPICSFIDLSISIRSGPSENSTLCITDTSYSIVRLQNGALWPHFRICWASDNDLFIREILAREFRNYEMKTWGLIEAYIINAKNSIARFNATRLVGWSVNSHVSYDNWHFWSTTQRQTKTSILPFHSHLCQFRGDAQTVLRDFVW